MKCPICNYPLKDLKHWKNHMKKCHPYKLDLLKELKKEIKKK